MDLNKTLQEAAEKLLSNLGVTAKVTVTEDKDNDAMVVDIASTEETGLLIGKKGESLYAIQSALSMMLKNKLGEWKRVVVNVGDYREKQEEYLQQLAKQAADKALDSGEPQTLYNLTAGQRRIIHLFLSTYDGVKSESQGEGVERYLVISKA